MISSGLAKLVLLSIKNLLRSRFHWHSDSLMIFYEISLIRQKPKSSNQGKTNGPAKFLLECSSTGSSGTLTWSGWKYGSGTAATAIQEMRNSISPLVSWTIYEVCAEFFSTHMATSKVDWQWANTVSYLYLLKFSMTGWKQWVCVSNCIQAKILPAHLFYLSRWLWV